MPPNPPSQRMLVRSSSVPMTRSSRRCTLCRLIVWNGAQRNGSEGWARWAEAIAIIREAWTLSKRIWVRVCLHDDALVFPLSTPRESIPCSVVISECESVNLRIAMRDCSRRSRYWNARTFSVSCRERGGVGVIFFLSCFVVGSRVKKPQRALRGWL